MKSKLSGRVHNSERAPATIDNEGLAEPRTGMANVLAATMGYSTGYAEVTLCSRICSRACAARSARS